MTKKTDKGKKPPPPKNKQTGGKKKRSDDETTDVADPLDPDFTVSKKSGG